MGFSFKQFFLGASLIAASFFPPLAGTRFAGLFLSFGAGRILTAVTAAGSFEQSHRGILGQSIDTLNALPIVYGIARVGSKVVYNETYDTPKGNFNEKLAIVCCLCLGTREPRAGEATDPLSGEIEGFGSIFFDDLVAIEADQPNESDSFFDGLPWSLEDNNTARSERFWGFSGVGGGDADFTYVNRHFGAHDQAADGMLVALTNPTDPFFGDGITAFPWTTDHRLQGIAYLAASIFLDTDHWPPGSAPPQISAILKGRRLYDPRDGEWGFSSNWALAVRDYLLDEKAGCASDPALLDEDSFKEMATVSDEIIGLSLSQSVQLSFLRRFTVNGAVDTAQSTLRNLADLLFTAGGHLVWEQGQWKLKRPNAEAPVQDLKLDENNIIGDWTLSRGEPEERANIVVANFVDGSDYDSDTLRDQALQERYPDEDEANPYLDTDDGFEVPREISLPYVNDRRHARAAAKRELEFGRNDLTVSLTAREEALAYSILDRVALSHQTFGFIERHFWVMAMGLNYDETVRLLLREIAQPSVPAAEPDPIEGQVVLQNTPIDNVWGGGKTWISYYRTGSSASNKPWLMVYDSTTLEFLKGFLQGSSLEPSSLSDSIPADAGLAYHPDRNELWANVHSDPTELVVIDADSMVVKAVHSFPGHDSTAEENPASIEYCPLDGLIYAFMKSEVGDEAANGERYWVGAIDPSDGSIVMRHVYDNSGGETVHGGQIVSMSWRTHDEKFSVIISDKDQEWFLTPGTEIGSQLQSGVFLIQTGAIITEHTYGPDEHHYFVPDRASNIQKWQLGYTDDRTQLTTFVEPEGIVVEYIPYLDAFAVARGFGNATDPPPGKVSILDQHGNFIRTWILDFAPARLSFSPEDLNLAVVSDWRETGSPVVEYLALQGIANVPDPPPDQPSDGTSPPPTSEPEPDPTPPPADAPTIDAARDYCIDSMVGGTDNWTGSIETGVEIDYTDSASHVGVAVQVGVWSVGADPGTDNPDLTGATVIDPDTVQLKTYEETHTDPLSDKERPVCPGVDGAERDKWDQFFDVRIRHDLGGGSFSSWSNVVTVRVKSPRKLVEDDPDQPATVTDAPIWLSAKTRCQHLTFEDGSEQVNVLGEFDALAANHGENGEGLFPVEYEEYLAGDVPGTDNPQRNRIVDSRGRYKLSWLFWRETATAAEDKPSCGGPSSTPDETRDYYIRHVLDGVGGRGPRSDVRTLTYVHPGPD